MATKLKISGMKTQGTCFFNDFFLVTVVLYVPCFEYVLAKDDYGWRRHDHRVHTRDIGV